jgi:hypothetical protein
MQYQYILIEGEVSYNIKSDTNEELVNVGTGYPGFAVYPEIFIAPRYVCYTITCEKCCTFLAITEDTYNKYLKKLTAREVDGLLHFLS